MMIHEIFCAGRTQTEIRDEFMQMNPGAVIESIHLHKGSPNFPQRWVIKFLPTDALLEAGRIRGIQQQEARLRQEQADLDRSLAQPEEHWERTGERP